ncbi:hypothetical protein [Phage f2b1]|nr:hypothetical protein [Phage f2b1]
MPMADGVNSLQKIAFQVGGKIFRFAINPDSMQQSRPHRSTVIKTKSRIVVEDFGADVATVTISGTTGYNPTGAASDRGVRKIAELKQFLKDYEDAGGNGDKSTEDFYFHDFTNGEYFVVHLSSEGVTYSQDANSPLTHRYEIKFAILRNAGDPPDDEVVSPEIGNRFPTLPNGSGGLGGVDYGSGGNSGVGSGVKDSNGKTDDDEPYDPSSGNDNIYNKGTTDQGYDATPVNPQSPSPSSYSYGTTGLGYAIGYYGR